MKKISELGLELIELEDQVLLVDKTTIELDHWYFNERTKSIARCNEMNIGAIKSMNQDGLHKVCYSTKPLEGLPLLVIEDEVEDIVGENLKRICSWETYQDHPIGRYAKQALQEHEKAKGTFKFTELDLRFALDYGRSQGYEYASMETFQDSEDLKKLELEQKEDKEEFIQSLTKKELWIEVEEKEYPVSSVSFDSVKFSKFDQPKITNNQIKAVWK